MKILLIDDDPEAKTFVERAMPQGCTLDYAGSLATGVEIAQDRPYDLILTDLRMPEVPNGDALTAMLRASPQSAIMVITALHFPAYAASLIRQGAVWVTFKPDDAIEPEIAERLLGESMLFAVARHEAQQAQLLSLSSTVAAVEELKREIRELRKDRERLAVLEVQQADDGDEMRRLWGKFEAQHALEVSRAAEREKGKWGTLAKIIGLVGTGLAAILGPWAASRWGRP